MKMQILSVALMSSMIGLGAKASPRCLTRMENAAIMALASERDYSVTELKIARSEMGPWTEAVADNKRNAQVTVYRYSRVQHYQVSARQIGSSDRCEVTDIKKMNPADIDPLALQAEKYKMAVGDVLYISESDDTWSAYYNHAKVEGFTESEIQKALNTEDPVEIYSLEQTLGFLKDPNLDDSEAQAYSELRRAMLKDFKEIRMIKVGVPDSGTLLIFILGITKEGHLIGVTTTSVET